MVKRGEFFLYDSIVPALEAGRYTLRGKVDLETTDNEKPAVSTFPPANSEGAFDSRLPQIVLKKRTLPWDRKADAIGKKHHNQKVRDTTPWLALVVIAEGEGAIEYDVPVAECVTQGITLGGDADTPRASRLSVPESTVKKVFPTLNDLAMLTHVREVNLDDTEAAMGDDDGFLAVVIANRMPVFDSAQCESRRYTACLINLEGQLAALPAPPLPRLAYDNTDIFISDLARRMARATASGQAVPLRMTSQPQNPPGTSSSEISDAIRRGDVIYHDGQLVDRTGTTGHGLNILGEIAAEDVLDGDFSSLGINTEQVWYLESAADAFRIPIDKLTTEPIYRFPVLTSWSFTATGAGSFERLMKGLDVGLLGTTAEGGYERPLPECLPRPGGADSGDPPPARLPLEVAETGHAALPHLTRLGSHSTSWYRGPFSPWPLMRRPVTDRAGPTLAHVSDHLRIMTPDGREDVSLAVAFETGRLMAMSQPSLIAAMMRWRAEKYGAKAKRDVEAPFLLKNTGILDEGQIDRLIQTAELNEILEIIHNGFWVQLNSGRGDICPERGLVGPGMDISALQGDLVSILAEGLGLDHALLAQIAQTPDDPQLLEQLQAAGADLMGTEPLQLDESLDAALGETLSSGVQNLAAASIGKAALASGEIADVEVFTKMIDFIDNHFGKGR